MECYIRAGAGGWGHPRTSHPPSYISSLSPSKIPCPEYALSDLSRLVRGSEIIDAAIFKMRSFGLTEAEITSLLEQSALIRREDSFVFKAS